MSEREFRIMGPLEAVSNGGPVELRPGKQTAVLGMLLVNAGEVVPTDVLIEALWGESPPATAANGIQLYVSGLRKLLGRDAIATRPGGYLLQARPDEIDARRFERLVAAARDPPPPLRGARPRGGRPTRGR